MKRLGFFASAVVVAAVVLLQTPVLYGNVQSDKPAVAQAAQCQMPGCCAGDMKCCAGDQAMSMSMPMPMHEQMMAGMKPKEDKLDQLMAKMNSAKGDAKVTAMAAVITALVEERATMHDGMKMPAGKTMDCPMMKKMMKK